MDNFQAGVLRKLQELEHEIEILKNPGPYNVVVAGGISAGVASPAAGEILTSLTGVFAPAFTGSTGAGTFTYVHQLGYYTKLGGMVFIFGWVAISAITVAPTGNMTITGLPFVSNASGDRFAMTIGQVDNFNYTNTAFQLVGRVNAGNSQVALQETFDNVAEVAVPAANFTNAACSIIFSGFYRY